jgi:dephospho-CoA kinase
MIRVALTGGIGTGKSTTLGLFERLGVPTLSADAVVHQLLRRDGAAYALVAKRFPDAKKPEGICRKTLGQNVFSDAEALRTLEAILHPLVQKAEQEFLHHAHIGGHALAVVEIPLLFETGGQKRFDVVVVTSASAFLKWKRVKDRDHMTRERFDSIVKRQWPDAKKLARADFVVHTGLGKASALRQVETIVRTLCAK